MGIHGSTNDLVRLQAEIRRAGAGGLRNRLLKAAAAEALTQVQLEFRSGVDPRGMPWAAPKFRSGQPLRDSGQLANSFSSRATESGFVVGTNAKFAHVHQTGMVIVPKNAKALRFRPKGHKAWIFAKRVVIPKREMVPWPKLSEPWAKAIQAAVNAAFQNYWKRFAKR